MAILGKDLVCQQAVELVTAYLEGALSWRQRRRYEAHVRGCPNCHAYLEQIRTTIAATGRLDPETLSPEVRDELVELFRRQRRR
jgi:anti-sigma factor RsiW